MISWWKEKVRVNWIFWAFRWIEQDFWRCHLFNMSCSKWLIEEQMDRSLNNKNNRHLDMDKGQRSQWSVCGSLWFRFCWYSILHSLATRWSPTPQLQLLHCSVSFSLYLPHLFILGFSSSSHLFLPSLLISLLPVNLRIFPSSFLLLFLFICFFFLGLLFLFPHLPLLLPLNLFLLFLFFFFV